MMREACFNISRDIKGGSCHQIFSTANKDLSIHPSSTANKDLTYLTNLHGVLDGLFEKDVDPTATKSITFVVFILHFKPVLFHPHTPLKKMKNFASCMHPQLLKERKS